MSPNTATWGQIVEFLGIDGWQQTTQHGGKRQRHIFYEKPLPDGRVLQTHVSHAVQRSPSPGRFGAILRDQLEVSRDEFWAALSSGKPVDRPVPLDDDQPVEHEPWVVEVLANQLHMRAEEIAELDQNEARALVYEHWGKPKE